MKWAPTQNHVTLSPAEAELIAPVKCTQGRMGIQSMMRDWGQESATTLYANSSAALAIAKRKGAGKLRHINVSALWIQDVQDREGTVFHKIDGTMNPADLMTKYLARDKIDGCLATICQVRRARRAEMGLNMQRRGPAQIQETAPEDYNNNEKRGTH